MEHFENCLGQVLEEASRQVAHQSSIARLEQAFRELQNGINIPLPKDVAAGLVDASVKCYHMSFRVLETHLKSNNKFLLEFVLRMRLVSVEATLLVLAGVDQHYTACLLNKELIEKLVVTARMVLNNGPAFANRAKPINRLVEDILPSVDRVPLRVLFLHYVNCCEYSRYECEQPTFELTALKQWVELISKMDFSNPRDLKYRTDYQPLLDTVLMEVCTRLLKKGVDVSQLLQYLPEEYKVCLLALYQPEKVGRVSVPGVSTAYFELYQQVKEHGLERIDLAILKDILSKNWSQRGYFEIIYVRISECIKALSVWFQVFNDKGSSNFLTQAYRMFIAAANNYLTDGRNTSDMVELCLLVVGSFSVAKKKPSEQIVSPLKKCMMVLIELLSQCYEHQQKVFTLFDELTAVIKRVKFFDHHKDLQKMMCIYLLVRKSPQAERCYREYLSNTKGKSQKDVVSLLYQSLHSTGQERVNSITELVKTKSAAGQLLLMSEPLCILQLPNDCLSSFKEPMSYYCLIFSKELTEEDFLKGLKHLHYSFEHLDLKQSAKFLKNIQQLIIQRIKQGGLPIETEYFAVLDCLYCQTVLAVGDTKLNNNLSPNQFYRLNMWLGSLLSQPTQPAQMATMGSLAIFKCLEKLLQQKNSTSRISLAVGELEYLNKLFEMVGKNSSPQQTNAAKFAMLQIYILTEAVPVVDLKKMISTETSKQQLQLYNTIEYLPEQVKAALLRKIVLISIQSNERAELNPDDLKKLILISQQKQERMIYIRELLLTGDPECQTFVEILASMYPEVAEALVQEVKE